MNEWTMPTGNDGDKLVIFMMMISKMIAITINNRWRLVIRKRRWHLLAGQGCRRISLKMSSRRLDVRFLIRMMMMKVFIDKVSGGS